jgi:hypothetical protein
MVFEVFGHYQQPVLHRVAIQDASNQQLQQKNGLKDLQPTAEVAAAAAVPAMVSSENFANETAFFPTTRPPPKRMLPQPSLPISQPVKSARFNASGGVPTAPPPSASAGKQNDSDSPDAGQANGQPNAAMVHAKHDLLVWFEVLELGTNLIRIESIIIYSSMTHYIIN